LRTLTLKACLYYGMKHPLLGGGWGLIYPKPRVHFGYEEGVRERVFDLEGHASLATPHSLPALVLVESGWFALLAFGLFVWTMWKALALPDPRVCPRGTAIVQ
ncbi:MAG: hypothetical protein GTN78_17055, partial [Gemmatimonadales bacterium]|nr:hypothetical protein [Gemmatimonadales bacterium]